MIIKIDRKQLEFPTLFKLDVAKYFRKYKCNDRHNCKSEIIICDKTIKIITTFEEKMKAAQ